MDDVDFLGSNQLRTRRISSCKGFPTFSSYTHVRVVKGDKDGLPPSYVPCTILVGKIRHNEDKIAKCHTFLIWKVWDSWGVWKRVPIKLCPLYVCGWFIPHYQIRLIYGMWCCLWGYVYLIGLHPCWECKGCTQPSLLKCHWVHITSWAIIFLWMFSYKSNTNPLFCPNSWEATLDKTIHYNRLMRLGHCDSWIWPIYIVMDFQFV